MSTISASTTTTTAYKVTADTTGTLVLQTGSTPTTAVTIDTSQNMGLGAAASSWATYTNVLQSGRGSFTGTAAQSTLTYNAYYNSGWKYVGTGDYAQLYEMNNTSGAHTWKIAGTGTAGNAISFTQAMTLDASGNLLVGKTSQSLSARTESDAASAGGGGFATANTATTPTGNAFYSNFTNGNNTSCLHFYGRAGAGDRIYIYGNGNIVNSNNSYGSLSDIKLKENITDATPKLEQLNQVRVVNYNLIGETQKQIGVVAQELETVFPNMVEESPDYEEVTTTDEEGNEITERVATGTTTKSVKYSVFVPMLIKAIQEQQAIIEQLTNRISALENK